jgi:hypothetical protein
VYLIISFRSVLYIGVDSWIFKWQTIYMCKNKN